MKPPHPRREQSAASFIQSRIASPQREMQMGEFCCVSGHKQAPNTLEYKNYTLKLIARTTAMYLEVLRRISGMYKVLIEFRFPSEEEKEKKM